MSGEESLTNPPLEGEPADASAAGEIENPAMDVADAPSGPSAAEGEESIENPPNEDDAAAAGHEEERLENPPP